MENDLKQKNRFVFISIALVLIVTMFPGNGSFAGNYIDKLVHFFIFFLLTISVCSRFKNPNHLITALLLSVLFGLFTEVVQQFIPGRNMDIYDGIADTLGVVVAYYFYRAYSGKIDSILS